MTRHRSMWPRAESILNPQKFNQNPERVVKSISTEFLRSTLTVKCQLINKRVAIFISYIVLIKNIQTAVFRRCQFKPQNGSIKYSRYRSRECHWMKINTLHRCKSENIGDYFYGTKNAMKIQLITDDSREANKNKNNAGHSEQDRLEHSHLSSEEGNR